LFGLLGAWIVASEPVAYIASMSFGILLFLMIPIVLVLVVSATVMAIQRKVRYSAALFSSAILLPTFFIGGLQAMRAVGWARYEAPGVNDMRPIGSELENRIVFAFEKTATQEEIRRFDEDVLRKKIPQPNGVLLEFADGVCNFSYPQLNQNITIVDVPFCAEATEVEKARIREQIVSSPLIYTAFEDIGIGQVRKLK
jgi:hypothetical protein